MPEYRVVIPARYASQRLPGKALKPIAGKPMIQWVWEHACAAGAREVLIATDDERIAAAARRFGAEVVMTAPTHASGTDRIAEVAERAAWDARAIVVNVQGDEPGMPPALIAQVARELAAHDGADIATLVAPLARTQWLDPNVVKAVADQGGRALYFSRAPIPCVRGEAPSEPPAGARRHIGLYAYRVEALRRLSGYAPTPLERLEQLEQLRALEHGMQIRLADAEQPPGQDVNTEQDLVRAERELSGRG